MGTVSSVIKATQGAVPSIAAQRVLNAARRDWTLRRDRPWLGLIAVPLAMNASGLMHLWWQWVPLLLGAAACTPKWRWSWILSFQLGALGTEWAYLGATSLAQWPMQRLMVGAIWAWVALCLAGTANLNREIQELQRLRRLWRQR